MREIIARGGIAPATAVVEDGRLVEYIQDEAGAMADTVLLGKVVRIIPGLQAAFVDIGEEKNGFLPLAEKKLGEDAVYRGISAALQTGDRVLVQVRREAIGTKGAFLSRDISLTGSYTILMPRNTMIGISSRITSESRREELKAAGRRIADRRFGLVMRTSSEDVAEEDIRSEAERLYAVWQEIEQKAATAHAPSVVYQKAGSAEALMTDYLPKGVDSVCTDIQQIYDRYHSQVDVALVEHDPIAARGLENECIHALERKVWLKSGGNLVVDECEALTVIDINSAKSTGGRKDRQVLLRTNIEACREIARQVRLRNLGGIILIDMIDMETEDERRMILDTLQKEFMNDRVKTVIHGFTSLGLVEMTRRRSYRTARECFEMQCPKCRGRGYIPKHLDRQSDSDERSSRAEGLTEEEGEA